MTAGTDGPVLVIGATGRVGGALIHALASEGVPVRALIRSEAGRALLPEGTEVIIGELGQPSALAQAVDDVSAAFVALRDHPQQIEWECALIDALERHGNLPFVKLSAYAAGLDPPPGYGRIHRSIERHLMASSLAWTVLRPYLYMQNCLDMAPAVRRLRRLPLPLGRARVALIDARDVALAAARVLAQGSGQGVYELTGPQALDGDELATELSRSLGRGIHYSPLPQWLAGGMMRLNGIGAWDVAMRAELFAMIRANGEARVNNVFSRLTGKAPRTFADFLNDHASAFGGGKP